MMATLGKPAYRNVTDSVNRETQVSVSCLYHTEVHVWGVGNYTPPLLRHLGSEEKNEDFLTSSLLSRLLSV